MKKFFLFLLLISLLTGCRQSEKLNDFETNDVVNSDNLKAVEFEIYDSLYLGVSDRKIMYEEKDSLYIITLNGMQQKLEILNLTSKRVKSIINLSENPDLSKNQFNADEFIVHNLDSIFLLSNFNKKLSLISHKNEVSQSWNLNDVIGKSQSEEFLEIDISSTHSMKYDSLNNLIYFKTHSPYNFDKDITYYKKPFLISFDLNKGEFVKHIGQYPEANLDEDEFFVNSYEVSYIASFDNNYYMASFNADHNIYQYSLLNNNLLETIDAKSNYLDEFSYIPRNSDQQTKINTLIKTGKYKKLLFNKFNKQIYRIVTHNQSLINPEGRLNNMTFGRDFSIVIIDKNLNKIEEILFEDPDFTFFNVIEHPQGILIMTKDETNENVNKFKIYNL